jgi:hypothetical protein
LEFDSTITQYALESGVRDEVQGQALIQPKPPRLVGKWFWSPGKLTSKECKLKNTFMAAALSLASMSAALAAPVVANNSSYNIFFGGEVSGTGVFTNSFDGAAENFSLHGVGFTINDSESAVAPGQHRLLISMQSSGNLFPVVGEGSQINVGLLGDGLDLLGNYYLEDARIRYFVNGQAFFETANLADDYRAAYFTGPWSGYFSTANSAFGIGNSGGHGINGVELDFLVSALPNQVPEPGTLALVLPALLWLAKRRRA